MAIEFPPECAWLFAILTGEVPPDGDEDKMFALAEVHRDLQGKLNQDFQALVAEALGFTKEKFDGDAGKMYQEAMKSFLGGQEGLDYFKAVGDQAQLMADFTRKSATQLQYTKYMIIAQLVMLLVEAAIAAATAFFFGASIAAYMQKMAIIRWLIKSWIGRMILTLLTHQIINVGLGVALDAMVQWVQLNQGTRDEWDTELTKNAALSGMVQGFLAGPFNFLGDRFGKFLAKRFGLDAGPDLGKQIDDILNPPKPKDKSPDLNPTPPPGSGKPDPKATPDPKAAPTPDPNAPTPPPSSGKPETTGSTPPPNGTTPKPVGPTPLPPGKPDPTAPKLSPEPKKTDSGTGKGPSPAPERSFGQNLTEAFRKHLPNTYGPAGPKVQQEFIKDVGEAFQKQFGDKAGKEAAREAGENWAKALLEKTGTKGLPDDLGNALKPITGDLGDDLTKVLTKGTSDTLGLSIMREIVEGTGRGVFEGAHAAVSEGMYNLIFSDEHTFKTSGLTFASGMVEGRLGAMMEAGGENLAMGLRGNLGMNPPSGLTAGDLGPGGDGESPSPAAATSPSTEQTADDSFDEDSDYGLAELFAHEDDDLDYLEPWEGDSALSEGPGDGGEDGDGRNDEAQPETPPVNMVSGPAPLSTGAGAGSPVSAAGGGSTGAGTAGGNTATNSSQAPAAAQPSGTGAQQQKQQPNGSDQSSSTSGPGGTDSTGHRPTDLSTEGGSPPPDQPQNRNQDQGQDQDQDRNGAGEQSSRHDGERGDDASAGEQTRPVTESTIPAPNPADEPGGEDGVSGHRSPADANADAAPIPPVTSSDGPAGPERTSVGDSAHLIGSADDTVRTETGPVLDTTSGDRTRTGESVPPNTGPTPSPLPETDQQTPSGRRSRIADDDSPLFPASAAPPANDRVEGSGTRRAPEVMSPDEFTRRTTSAETGPRDLPPTVLRPGDGVMSPDDFKKASSGSGIRSKSAIDAVDKALGAYHKLPRDLAPSDRAFELRKIVTACDDYLKHKGSGGGPRVEGVVQLRERASYDQVDAFLQHFRAAMQDAGPKDRRDALEGLVSVTVKYLEIKGDADGPRAQTVRELGERASIGAVDTALRALHGLPEDAGPLARIEAFKNVVAASGNYLDHKGEGGGPRVDGVRALAEQARDEGSRLGEEIFRKRLETLDTLLNEGRLHEGPSLPGEAQKAALAVRPDRFHSMTDELVQELFSLGDDPAVPEVTRNVIDELKEVKRLVTVMQYGKGGMKLTSPADAPPTFTFNVDTQARSGTSFMLGHIAHELTHVAAFQAFGSSPVMELAPSGTRPGDIKDLAAKRATVLADLKQALADSDAFGGPKDVRRLLLEEKLDYGKQPGKLAQYANAFWAAKVKWDTQATEPGATAPTGPPPRHLTAQERDRLLAWDEKAGNASGTLVEYDTVLNQMLVYMHQWKIPEDNPFYALLRDAAETAFERRNPGRTTSVVTESTRADDHSSAPAPSAPGGPSSAPVPTTSTTGIQTSQAPPATGPAPTRPEPPAQPMSSPAPGRAGESPLPAPKSATYMESRPDAAARPPRVRAEQTTTPVTAERLTRVDDAPLARVHTERFDPVLGQRDRRPGLLNGSMTLIRNHVRREHFPDGLTVRHFVVTLPVRPGGDLGDGDVRQLETRLQNTLNETLNSGYVLPKSGDQLRITVELESDPAHGEAVDLTRDPQPGRADQLHWDLGHDDGTLVHELLHYLGLPDEYLDTTNGRKTDGTHVFRSDARLTGVHTTGPMAGTDRRDLDMLSVDHLRRIEDVSDTVNIPSHTPGPDSSAVSAPTPRSTGASRTRLAADDDPTHPSSGTPEQVPRMPGVEEFVRNTSGAGQGTAAASGSRDGGRRVMSLGEFQAATKSSGIARRSSSEISAVDNALRAFHELPPGTAPVDRIAVLGGVVRKCADYLQHKEEKGGSRVDGVRRLHEAASIGRIDIALEAYHRLPSVGAGIRALALKGIDQAGADYLSEQFDHAGRSEAVQLLRQQATGARGELNPERVFRDLLGEVDAIMRRGGDPDDDKRLITDVMRDSAKDMDPGDFHRMMAAFGDDLNRLRDDPTLPTVTDAVIREVMAVKDLVTVARYTIATRGMAYTPEPGGADAFTFYVDTQARGGSSFLLGHIAHELTHIAAHQAFGSSPAMELVPAGTNDADVGRLATERGQVIRRLLALTGDFDVFQRSLLEEKLQYGVQANTLERYADNLFNTDPPVITAEQRAVLKGWGAAAEGASSTLVEYDTVLNQMLVYLHMWGTPLDNRFYTVLRDEARTAYDRREAARTERESSARRSRLADAGTVPVNPTSAAPPKNDQGDGSGTRRADGVSSDSAATRGGGTMSAKEFARLTASGTGSLRSRSGIGGVDSALRAFHALPEGTPPIERLFALNDIVKAGKEYIEHKGEKGGPRVPATEQLVEEIRTERSPLGETIFRSHLAEIDRLMASGRQHEGPMLPDEARRASQAVLPDRFQAMIGGFVEQLFTMRDDPTLPPVTRRVIDELSDIRSLVTVLRYPMGHAGMTLTPAADGAPAFTFNVDTQPRGGTPFLLGHIAHELTHVAAHQAFGSSAVMELMPPRTDAAEVGALAGERAETIRELRALAGDGSFDGFRRTLLEEKLDYGRDQGKLKQYARIFHDHQKIGAEDRDRLFAWEKAAGDASGTLVEYDTVLNQMLVYLHMWGTPQDNPFYARLRNEAEAAFVRRESARSDARADDTGPPSGPVPTVSESSSSANPAGTRTASARPDDDRPDPARDVRSQDAAHDAPAHSPSASPPKNDPPQGSGPAVDRWNTDGVMTLDEFKKATPSSGLGSRANSGIGAVDESLRTLRGLSPDTAPRARLGAFVDTIKACDDYIQHKGKKGGERVNGVRALREQLRTELARLDSETRLRGLMSEIDQVMRSADNPGEKHPWMAGEVQNAAQALSPDRFHAVMDEFVGQLGDIRGDSTLPAVTRRVLDEVMDVRHLVSRMRYPQARPGMTLTPGPDGAPAFTFNVDTQTRSGSSFLLGHIAHELTHVAAHQAFRSSAVMELAPSRATDAQIRDLAAERKRTLEALEKTLERGGGFKDLQSSLLDEKLGYGSQPSKLAQYANSFLRANRIDEDERQRLVKWDGLAGDASGTLVEYDTVLNQMLVYLHMWGTPLDNPFYTQLRQAAESAFDRREEARRAEPVPPVAPDDPASDATTGAQPSQAPTPPGTRAPHGLTGGTTTAPDAPKARPVTTVSGSSRPAESDRAALAYQLLNGIPPAPPPPPAVDAPKDAPATPPRTTPGRPPRAEATRPLADRVARPVAPRELAAIGEADGPWAAVRTERFDPVLGQRDRRPGLLNGSATLIRHQVRREDLQDGRVVRHFRLTLPVRAVGDLDASAVKSLETRLQDVLDTTLNSGYELPRSGDQLRVTLDFRPARSGDGEAVTLTRTAEPGRADQLRWDVSHDDGILVHELLHYLGLPDEYLDTRDGQKSDDSHLFRSDSRLGGVRESGLMATADRADLDALPADYLQRIEDVSDTVNIPSNGPGPVSPVRPTPFTAGVGEVPRTAAPPEAGGDFPASASPPKRSSGAADAKAAWQSTDDSESGTGTSSALPSSLNQAEVQRRMGYVCQLLYGGRLGEDGAAAMGEWLKDLDLNGLCGGWVTIHQQDPGWLEPMWQALVEWQPEGSRTDPRAGDLEQLKRHLRDNGVGEVGDEAKDVVIAVNTAWDIMRRLEPDARYRDVNDLLGDSTVAPRNYDAWLTGEQRSFDIAVDEAGKTLADHIISVTSFLQDKGRREYYARIETPTHHMGVRLGRDNQERTVMVCETEVTGIVSCVSREQLRQALQNGCDGHDESHIQLEVTISPLPGAGRRS